MFDRSEIKDVFFHQKKLRINQNKNIHPPQQPKLGQTLKCFSLQKNPAQHQQASKTPLQRNSLKLIRIASKKQMENFTRLVEFYQTEKNKRCQSLFQKSQKNKIKKSSINYFPLTPRPSSIYDETIGIQHKKTYTPIISSNKNQQYVKFPEPLLNESESFSIKFPSQLCIKRTAREPSAPKRITTIREGGFESIMRRAFIPSVRQKSSLKKQR